MISFGDIDAVAFVKAWQAASEVKPLAEKFKMTPAEASRFAAILRKQGVPLKKFREPVKLELDVEALKKLVK